MLCTKLENIWSPNGDYMVVDLDNDYFMVKFDDEEDYSQALLNGLWTVFSHYLLVQPWNPSFSIDDINLSTVATWIRFLGLPMQYYHKSVLCTIASLIGRPLKIDYSTQEGIKG